MESLQKILICSVLVMLVSDIDQPSTDSTLSLLPDSAPENDRCCPEQDAAPGSKLFGVKDVAMEHWGKFGRNFFSRYDYEEVDSAAAGAVMDQVWRHESVKMCGVHRKGTGCRTAHGAQSHCDRNQCFIHMLRTYLYSLLTMLTWPPRPRMFTRTTPPLSYAYLPPSLLKPVRCAR